MLKRAWLGTVLFLALVSLLGCSTNNAAPLDPGRDTSGFILDVQNDSYIDGGSASGFDISFEEFDDSLLVNVRVNGAQDLKALYFNLAYDPGLYRPMTVANSGLMGSGDEVVHLEYFKTTGEVVYGQVLANFPWRTGYTGNGTLATVMFAKEQALAVRTVSVAPTNNFSATTLTLTGNVLDWYYFNNGDYNQDGLVSINDLTPLGQHLGATHGSPITPYPITDALGQIDGNSDGALTINDVTNIGQWMNNSVLGGWSIYTSNDIGDMPATNGGPNGAGATEVVHVANGDAANFASITTERLHFTHDLGAAPPATAVYWARPMDAANALGTPSNAAVPPNPDAPVLAFTGTPISGNGSNSTPFLINPTSGPFNFTLIDPTDGHVEDTGAAGTTTWTLNPPAAGTVDKSGTPDMAVLTLAAGLADGYTFSIGAQYDTELSVPAQLFFEIDTGPLPTGEYLVPDAGDSDWTGILGTYAGTEADPYVLDNTDYTKTYDFTANSSEDGSGTDLTESDFTWTGYPPFVATWTVTGTAASMEANQFTSGYVFFQNGAMENSDNNVYVIIKDLPT